MPISDPKTPIATLHEQEEIVRAGMIWLQKFLKQTREDDWWRPHCTWLDVLKFVSKFEYEKMADSQPGYDNMLSALGMTHFELFLNMAGDEAVDPQADQDPEELAMASTAGDGECQDDEQPQDTTGTEEA